MIINTLTHNHDLWPSGLNHTVPPPKQLHVLGELNDLPTVAVVGTRRPTDYGRSVTKAMVSEIAPFVCIVSGMAIGIDAVAHRACLDSGGKTIAILPSPLDRPYPARHAALAKDIVNLGGALISEYGAKAAVHRSNFIARNRIVAAIADLVLVVEADEKSGTMHTVRFANELGKDVAAVPGSVQSIYSRGTNRLLKDGAHVVAAGEDILHLLGVKRDPNVSNSHITAPQQNVLSELSKQPMSVVLLASKLQLSESTLRGLVTELEMENLVARLENGMYARR